MNEADNNAQAISTWEEPVVGMPLDSEDALIVDVAGYEGPLDLLLALARTQKVDIAKISVLALADQYLAFIAEAQKLRLELAADYLVMAAWLAFLKSRLLLPREGGETADASAEELARRLAEYRRAKEAAAWLAGAGASRARTVSGIGAALPAAVFTCRYSCSALATCASSRPRCRLCRTRTRLSSQSSTCVVTYSRSRARASAWCFTCVSTVYIAPPDLR